jgi:membrane protease YdiL (CAAX protease family)
VIQPPFQLPNGENVQAKRTELPSLPDPGAPLVWLAVGGLLALMAVMALVAILNPPGISGEQLKIHRALSEAEAEWGLLPSSPGKEKVSEIIDDLESLQLESDSAKGTLARALLVLKQERDPTTEPDFSGMSDFVGNSKDALTPGIEMTKDMAELNESLRELYRGETLTLADRERIVDSLSSNEARWPLDIAAARAREPSSSDTQATRMAVVGIAGFIALAIGIAVLGLITVKPKPLGIPVSGSAAEGDRLGLRFLLFIATLLGIGVVLAGFQIAKVEMSQTLQLLLMQVAMIAAVLLIAWLPIGGRSYSPAAIGLRTDHFGKDCLYGIAAFFANLPAVAALAIFGLVFLRWIPSGGHPIQSELMDPSQVPLHILTVGPLTAFVEEVAFRGMLFQGLALRFRIWPAILLSSLGFAMIHPQGGALWLALAWIGGMAAYLTYQRKSLIPAIVMHACHNSVLILLYVYTIGKS